MGLSGGILNLCQSPFTHSLSVPAISATVVLGLQQPHCLHQPGALALLQFLLFHESFHCCRGQCSLWECLWAGGNRDLAGANSAPAWEGPEAQGPPAMPYPGIREELGVVGVSLGLSHGWGKEHSRVMQGFTFAACTWQAFSVRTQTFIFLGITTRL